MPTYEYRCGACGHAFEEFQRMDDEPVRECPDCGEEAAERIISSGAGLIFKGSGFYVTDYKRSSGGPGGDGEDADAPAAGDDGSAASGSGGSSESDD